MLFRSSELAALLELEVEDIKHQGGRLKNVAEGDIGKRSVEIVGEAHDMNYKKVLRYVRLNHLVPALREKVDVYKRQPPLWWWGISAFLQPAHPRCIFPGW